MQNFTSNHWKKINSLIYQNEEKQNFRRNKSQSIGMDDGNRSSIVNIACYNL